ncbi:iron uptake transporter permease EfeU [Williamsia sterculiae]|uniref:High-affinity iron transporter n=1 Tax=Williamsia sterculiae TaxID=1344003 RepID=A0A1N7DQC2_9NOCA|nr:iron uptake transporter permease EfeU [Williamsia sterculiae]SIR77885.1 high-affinity iron transporter [Williamsia sterculiae]
MFATLVIGLREGLEAALIVGIIAAFLRKQGRRDALVWMWIGVVVAVAICVAVAIGLEIFAKDLPQREQEALETVIGVVAVAMVTYMIVWMRTHAAGLKREIESAAQGAVHNGSALALASMAFLAVLREGLETAVFLIAAFNASNNPAPATFGALLGIGIAVALGYGIYRGGVRINLARFFRATGLLLVLVAAGLVMTAFHTAHEAGWVQFGQQQVVDLSWLVRPGSLQSSLLTGVLGIQPRPVLIEVIGWLVYVVVVGALVLWPNATPLPRRALGWVSATAAAALLVAAAAVYVTAPDSPSPPSGRLAASTLESGTTTGILTGRAIVTPRDAAVTIGEAGDDTMTGTLQTDGVTTPLTRLAAVDPVTVAGLSAPTYSGTTSPDIDVSALIGGAPTSVTLRQIIDANAGRTPVGLNTSTFGDQAPVVYSVTANVTASVDPYFHRPLSIRIGYVVTATATPRRGAATVLGKVADITLTHPASQPEADAVRAADSARQRHEQRAFHIPVTLTVLGAVFIVIAVAALRRRPDRSSRDDQHRAERAGVEEKKEIRQ